MPIRIRQARREAQFSQAQLAVQLGVCRSAVAQWERTGGTSPSVDHLAKVAIVTGVLFEWLATGRGGSHPEGVELDNAATTTDFAMDELESRILEAVRRLTRRKREMVCRVVELIAT
ncbi:MULTISPECIES: helix-turn-helix domain-containing protein [unclassified Luteimonas]